MKRYAVSILAGVVVLSACSPRDEYPHQTIQAYEANKRLRDDLLEKCANHITRKTAFQTEADKEECRKAYSADQNVRIAGHQARESRAANAALSEAARQFGALGHTQR